MKKIESKNISVVIQGPIYRNVTEECIKSIRHWLPDAEIILSTYYASGASDLDCDILVENNDPGAAIADFDINYSNNFNRQLITTQKGIEKSTQKYILKLRTDLVLHNTKFLDYYDKFQARNEKYSIFNCRVLCSAIYSKECWLARNINSTHPTPFHPSDFWFFGLAEDIKDYFLNTQPATEQELGNWKYKYPNRIPYPNAIFRYAPEQSFCYSWAKRKFPDISFEDLSDYHTATIELSNNILYNNFIFLGYYESGIFCKKHEWALRNENKIKGLITFNLFQKRYKQYCDEDFLIEDCSQTSIIPETQTKDSIIPSQPTLKQRKYNKYKDKIKKHYNQFIAPLSKIITWILQPFSILFYIIKLLLNSYFYKQLFSSLIKTQKDNK